MESGSSSNLFTEIGKPSLKLENLVKQHEEKVLRTQQLKTQIQETKQQLEISNRNDDVSQGKIDAFKALAAEYNCLRQEYNNALAAGKSRGSEN